MSNQKLTTDEKKSLANKAFDSTTKKADSYPAWMQSHFNKDLDAYYKAASRYAACKNL